MTKQEARRRYRAARAAVMDRPAQDAALLRVMEDAVPRAGALFIYLSLGTEPDTHALIRRRLGAGQTVLLPRCRDGGRMDAVPVGPDTRFVQGPYGIWEPEGAPYPLQEIAWAVVPGLAFSLQGWRLGYGGGYYDRFFQKCSARRLGICYTECIGPVPHDAWDAPMHALATPRGVLECDGGE